MKQITCLLLLLLLPIARLSAEGQTTLVVNFRDGTVISFQLSEQPRITFAGADMQVVSSNGEATFVRSEVKNYLFDATTTAIDEVASDALALCVKEGVLTLAGLPAGCAVTIFTIDGKPVTTGRVDDDGTFALSLNSLPGGVYLINYNNKTIKYFRK